MTSSESIGAKGLLCNFVVAEENQCQSAAHAICSAEHLRVQQVDNFMVRRGRLIGACKQKVVNLPHPLDRILNDFAVDFPKRFFAGSRAAS